MSVRCLELHYRIKQIENNGEYELFRDARMRGGFVKDHDLPQLYEEFIRNKALDNTFNVNGLFRTDRQLGIYSMADRFRSIIVDNPQLLTMFPVLNALRIEKNNGYGFIKQAVKDKRSRHID